jgi:23S rRNA (uracil1939-C5)-methyltransferase
MPENDLIIRVAARGDGVTADGRYVAYAAPGDHIDAAGGLVHGDRHVSPICPHFKLCGGCQLQHLDDVALEAFVAERITHALATQGVSAGTIMPTHLSPNASRRRVALRSSFAGKVFQLGFSTEKSHRIVDIKQCDVMAPELFALLAPLRTFLEPFVDRNRQIQIKLALVDQGVDVLIENWVANNLSRHEAISAFAQEHRLARLSLDEGYGPVPFWEPEPVTISFDGVPVSYPPYGFVQATIDGEAALSAAVLEIAGDTPIVADLFAGLGTFALRLAPGRKVYAAEAERAVIASLQAAASRANRAVHGEHRDLFRRPLDPSELNKFGAVVLDPPRAGARAQVEQLAHSTVANIAYVSCNPASFARDAKTLVSAGYNLQKIYPVGQFRWSTHIELVGHFCR